MNNTTTTKRNLAITAIFMAAILAVGTLATTTTVATTQSAFAYSKKGADKKDNGKGNDNGNTITIQKCKQAATQSGFDNNQGQECENLICTHPGDNATCVQEGAVAATTTTPPPPPVKLTCEQCIRKFLNEGQISELISFAGQETLEQVCDILHTGTQNDIQALFENISGSDSVAAQIIQCLLDAGIVFKTP
jgi:hypothetical protein